MLVSIKTPSNLTSSRLSSHVSNPIPLIAMASAFFMRWVSLTVGSQSCGSAPGGRTSSDSTLSPPTAFTNCQIG